jgi:NTP pyrophosphatase (non-canonical NTP hydrolase)
MRDISKELKLVRNFNDVFGHDQHDSLTIGKPHKRALRLRLFKEELGELFIAIYDKNKVEQLDATKDMLFILLGTVSYHGMDEMFINLMEGEKENFDTPISNYPVEITTLLNMANFERRYLAGSSNYREILLWLVELCTSVLSLYSKLESDGIVKPGSFAPAFKEVYDSNMSKLENGKPVLREDGKILKGKDYFKPNLEQFVNL